MLIDGWAIERKVYGWVIPPAGLGTPVERWVARSLDMYNKKVSIWIEAGAVQLLDEEEYYPGGCYGIPLAVIAKLQELACES